MTTQTAAARYQAALGSIPAPGGGGCHTALLGIANLGILAGITPEQIHDDIRAAIPRGGRAVPDREITDAIRKALADHTGTPFTPRPRPQPIVKDGQAALRAIIKQGRISSEVDLWEASPVRLLNMPQDDAVLLIETLYQPSDLLFIGERHDAGILGTTVRTAAAWIDHFRNGGQTAPHIIPNPLTGTPAPKKSDDGDTLRGDGNVQAFRFCVVEFDTLDRESQIRFWSAVKLPICALIDSGGKSIHAWLDVDRLAPVATADEWASQIKGRLYDAILTPLGADDACSNAARLSRLPGHYRGDRGAYQRLLWLSAEGKSICR